MIFPRRCTEPQTDSPLRLKRFQIVLGADLLTSALVSLSLLNASSLLASTHRVPQDFPRITDALAVAGSGDTIEVAAGTYSTSQNGEVFPLQLTTDNVALLGAGMDFCVIDAESSATVIQLNAATGRLSGFTLTRGRSTFGGGIHVLSGSMEIAHNLVIDNEASTAGSGIMVGNGASPWVHHNVVWENHDTNVAAEGDPHGIHISNAHGLYEHNLVGRGDSNGLLFGGASNPVVRNNIFYENGIPAVRGRGVCDLTGNASSEISHNLFYGNSIAALLIVTMSGGMNVSAEQANNLDSLDDIFGNVDGDPLFADEDNMDWNLTAASPAIDAGNPLSPLDPDGTQADIGPFYFNQSSVGVDDRTVTLPILGKNSPNPFSLRTQIPYLVDTPSSVRLTIHDIQGRLVATLIDEHKTAGEHRAIWDGRGDGGIRVPAGVYFARLVLGDNAHTRTLVLAP